MLARAKMVGYSLAFLAESVIQCNKKMQSDMPKRHKS